MLIYKITNDINSKIYIGQTTKTLQERIDNHRNSFISGVNTHLYNAMRKYGWDKFHFEIIVEVHDKDLLNQLEAYFISIYDTIKNGYNMAPGGYINTMESTIVKEKHLNKMQSIEVRNKISESMKASYQKRGGVSEQHRANLSKAKKAMYNSEKGQKVKEKFKSSFKLSPSHYHSLNSAKFKQVYCIDKDNNIHEFESVKSAAIWWYNNGYDSVKSSDQLSDKIKQSATKNKMIRGLQWKYRV